jgi:hypothetical protein
VTTSSTPDPRHSGRGCAIAVAAVGVVAVLLVIWGWISVDNWINPPAPDVHKIATSADVATADQAATDQLNNTLAQVRTTIPWITDAGRSADDVCSTDDNIAFIGEQPKWAPVRCMRTIAWFGAFEGDFPQQLSRINQTLERGGWTPQATPMDRLFQIDQAREATASPSPGSPRVVYASGSYSNGSQVLDVEVTELPNTPFNNTPQVAPAVGTAQEVPDGPVTFHREHRSVSLAALTQQLGHGNRFIIGIELNSQYYTAPDTTTPAPSAPTYGGGYACRTGAVCVGG